MTRSIDEENVVISRGVTSALERGKGPFYWLMHSAGCNGDVMESAITSKGQVTIPKAIREHLQLKPGDRVEFFVHPDGSVVLLPKLPVSVLRGMLKDAAAEHTPIASTH
jgi:AbrB family looped-hinge helix DNA binding protein